MTQCTIADSRMFPVHRTFPVAPKRRASRLRPSPRRSHALVGIVDPAIEVKVRVSIVGADRPACTALYSESAGTAEAIQILEPVPILAYRRHVRWRIHRDRRQDRVFEPLAR